jgi:hypothetical protein
MRTLKLILAGAVVAGLAGCQPDNPPLTGPQREPLPKADYQVAETSAKGLTVTFDTRVDILFVIDDSKSMRAHQQNLSANINKFVDAFANVNAIDFHIAYTRVHDRLRYGPIVQPSCGGVLNFEPSGTLSELKGLPPGGRRYLSKEDKDFRGILKSNLDPEVNLSLVKPFVNPDPRNPSVCAQGPENEESFFPLINALEDPTRVDGPNKGFRRPGAFFVAILVSDAKDESVNYGLTPEEVVRRLAENTGEAATGKKRFRIYSVAISSGTLIGTSKEPGVCMPDPAFADGVNTPAEQKKHGGLYRWPAKRAVEPGENPLETVARLTEDQTSPKEGQVLSICSPNYGTTLAKYGFQVQQDTLTDVTLRLPHRPQQFDPKSAEYATKRLRVFIGDAELTENVEWNYNPRDVAVVVYGQKIKWDKYPNEKIRVSYTPVDDTLKTTTPLRP